MVLIGVGSLLYALPHFTAGFYIYSASHEPLCYNTSHTSVRCVGPAVNTTDASTSTSTSGVHALGASKGLAESQLSLYRWIFILAQVVCAFGGVTVYSIGLSYIDENSTASQSAFFTGTTSFHFQIANQKLDSHYRYHARTRFGQTGWGVGGRFLPNFE